MIFTVKLLLPYNEKEMKDLWWLCRLKGDKRCKKIDLSHIITIAVQTLKEPVFQGNKVCDNLHLHVRVGKGTYIAGEYERILEDNPAEGLLTILQSGLDRLYRDAFIRNVRKYVLSLPDGTGTNGV